MSQPADYARSLMRIEVPVRVTLAGTRLPLHRILKLAPGAVIPFSKSCAEPLTLSIGNHDLAIGEAVTVGDHFGLRITAIAPAARAG